MAGQGSINMPAPGRSPIEGILTALQAVHAYYGIDTQKAQQKLLATQIRAEEPKAAEAEARGSELKTFMETGKMGPLMNKDQGYIVPPGQTAAQPSQPTRPQVLPVANTIATNDNVASDVNGSYLKGHIQKISDFASPIPNAPVAASGQPLSKDQWGTRTVSLPSGQTITMEPGLKLREEQQKYQNEVLTGKQKTQEIELARNKDTREGQEQKTKLQEAFNKDTQGSQDKIDTYKAIGKALISGNTADVNSAKILLGKTKLGVQRINEQTGESIDDKSWLAQLNNAGSRAIQGMPPGEELKKFIDAANSGQAAEASKIQNYAGVRGSQLEAALGIPADTIVSKLLLPKGVNTNLIQTEILPDKRTGINTLHILDGKRYKPISMK